jgi:hypothetical protein
LLIGGADRRSICLVDDEHRHSMGDADRCQASVTASFGIVSETPRSAPIDVSSFNAEVAC